MSVETDATPADVAGSLDLPMPPLPASWRSLGLAFVHRARSQPGKIALADSLKTSLTYGETLVRSLALGRVLARTLGPAPHVGVMIPPTVVSAVANVALTLRGKVPINLNYTANQGIIDSTIDQARVTHVLSTQKAIDRLKIEPKGTLVLLDEISKRVTAADKAWAWAVAKFVPITALGTLLPGLRGDSLDAPATVIFTSGSTGDPKGVVLSHRNILSNIRAIDAHMNLLSDEVVLGILPFFHAMGYTVTLWAVLCLGKKAAYHVNPLDARIIGELCEEHKATLIFGTPTFMRVYLLRCDRAQFATVRRVFLGAEKLKPELAQEIREKLGVEPLEGYGCTELSPVVSHNVNQDKTTRDGRSVLANRPGTVGMPLPGTALKTITPETGADLPRGSEGVILVKGPQVMVGYLDRPEATAKVIRDGWYNTGDIGFVDEDGFLKITDRQSRFSKIGGEMVPHLKVEAAILAVTGTDEQTVAVTALPDPKRGERLIVIHTDLGMSPAEIYQKLSAGELPRLWLPSADGFVQVEALPVIGTGKIDLRRLRQIAEERLGDRAPGRDESVVSQ